MRIVGPEKWGDCDALLEKWNDILTRAVDWKMKVLDGTGNDDEYHKFGYMNTSYSYKVIYPEHCKLSAAMEAVCTEDTKSLYFRRYPQVLGDGLRADDGTYLMMIYKPDTSEKTLWFEWNIRWMEDRRKAFPIYQVVMKFYTKNSESDNGLHGGGTLSCNPERGLYSPRMEDYRSIVGDKFYDTLIGFTKKVAPIKEELEAKKAQLDEMFKKAFATAAKEAEDANRKLKEEKRNRMKNDFDSL